MREEDKNFDDKVRIREPYIQTAGNKTAAEGAEEGERSH